MEPLTKGLADAGGLDAPRELAAQLRLLLSAEMEHGEVELELARSGRDRPVVVAFVALPGWLAAITPAPAQLRADPAVASHRAWLLVAAAVGALVEAADLPLPATADALTLMTGELGGHLLVAVPADAPDSELAALAFDEQAQPIDRLRAEAVELPAHVVDADPAAFHAPVGAAHPLRVAEALARHGRRPAGADEEDEAVIALFGDRGGATRPHEDPDPARRVARRILQRLNGMGKWGGFHTEFAHLARGFAGNERGLAEQVGEALLDEGLLAEKPSVGQRHVFLNPRRAGEIHALIDTGEAPPNLRLP